MYQNEFIAADFYPCFSITEVSLLSTNTFQSKLKVLSNKEPFKSIKIKHFKSNEKKVFSFSQEELTIIREFDLSTRPRSELVNILYQSPKRQHFSIEHLTSLLDKMDIYDIYSNTEVEEKHGVEHMQLCEFNNTHQLAEVTHNENLPTESIQDASNLRTVSGLTQAFSFPFTVVNRVIDDDAQKQTNQTIVLNNKCAKVARNLFYEKTAIGPGKNIHKNKPFEYFELKGKVEEIFHEKKRMVIYIKTSSVNKAQILLKNDFKDNVKMTCLMLLGDLQLCLFGVTGCSKEVASEIRSLDESHKTKMIAILDGFVKYARHLTKDEFLRDYLKANLFSEPNNE